MGSFKLFGTELKSLKNRKGALIALIGVLLIPIVYCAVLLSATWGPYDNLNNLPVAVINKDAGAVSDGNPINVGEDLVATLKESNTLGWDFVSEEEAKAGLESNKYYMLVEIPEDFSQKVTTVLTDNPQEPELKYIQNEGLNYMGSQVTNSAVERLREQLGDKITATYATTLLSKFGDVGTGFSAAADGSSQIYDGTVSLSDGTNTLLTSLTEKAPDIAKLAAGAQTANEGAGTLLSSVQKGTGDINTLASGAGQIASGVDKLNAGAKTLAGGLKQAQSGGKELEAGLSSQLVPGAKQLAAGAAQVGPGAAQFATGATGFVTGADQAVTGLEAVVAGVGQVAPGAQQVAGGVTLVVAGAGTLEAGAKTLAGGVTTAITGVGTLETGAQSVAGGATQVVTGAGTLEAGAQAVANGLAALLQNPALAANPDVQKLAAAAGQVSAGITDLKTKAGALETGAKQVAGGLTQLKSQAGQLETGAKQVSAGITDLKTKAGALETGANQVAAGLGQINSSVQSKLAGGVQQLRTGVTQLETGAQQLAAASQLSAGAQTLATALEKQILPGVQSLNSGLTQLSTGAGTLTAGTSTLDAGTDQLAAGTQKLQNSWGTLTNGVSSLKTGLVQIADGNQTVNTGWGTLTDGATQLNDGANKLKDGSETLSTSLSSGAEQVNGLSVTDKNIAMFATPVKTVGEKVNSYTYYRDSTAPYILSLALFVGMLVLSFFVDFKKPATLPGSAFSWFVSKWLQLALFAVIQAVLVALFALFVLGLDFANPGLFILFAIFTSITFMSIVFFLVSVGGNIGRFIALVFIVLQLSITGSNLPIAMLPENLRNLSQFLPLTYSNAGFKSVISLGDTSLLSSNVGVLAIWLVATSALALVAFILSYRTLRTSTTPSTSEAI